MQHLTTYQFRRIRYTFFICAVLFLVSSCSTQKYLKEGETFLKKNEIKIIGKENVDKWRVLDDELATLAFQKPNSKFLWINRRWFHYRVDEPKDTSKFDNFIRKRFAEEPAVYNEDLANATAEKMVNYLNERGYFKADVRYKPEETRRKKTVVVYEVLPNKRYYFDTITYSSNDVQINNILQKVKEESLIKRNDPVDDRLYSSEVRRITAYLKENGYANFYTNYIPPLEGDSTGQKVNAEFKVLLTKDSTQHKIYTIGDIYVDLLFNPKDTFQNAVDSIVNGIHFLYDRDKLYIRPKALVPKIFLKKHDIYKLSDIEKTRVQLGNLDIFQFVDIKRLPHPEFDTVLNYQIRLIPKRRMELGTSFEVNNSQILASSRSLLGFAASLNYKNRNIFKGAEVFSMRAEGGVEINPGNPVNTWDLNLGGDFSFPKLIDHPLGTTKLVRKFSKKGYQLLREQASTKGSVDYSILSSIDQYNINIFTGSWSYNWRDKKNNRFAFTQIGINFLDPNFDQGFQDTVLSNNPFLQNSLSEQLFTGFIARDFTALFQTDINRKGNSWFFQGNIEQSGAEIAATNGIYNLISSNVPQDTFRFLGNKYEFSQYVRLELEGRFNRRISSSKSFASRLHFGIALPFAYSDDVPYTKQFSAGGPNSMRGWRIRELGPGSYLDPNPTDDNLAFFQTGDLKLEMNAEYRFNIYWFLKGAVFLDVGNIWAIKEKERKGANFDLNEFAVGSGFGFRFDFSIFLFRLDLGLKLRSPYPDETGRYWIVRTPSDINLQDFNWNVAVGYPF